MHEISRWLHRLKENRGSISLINISTNGNDKGKQYLTAGCFNHSALNIDVLKIKVHGKHKLYLKARTNV
jgi:hypothetical protein